MKQPKLISPALLFPRNNQWATVRKKYLQQHPNCVACNVANSNVQVHHIFPVQFIVTLGRPDLELDSRNFLTLCEKDGEPNDMSQNHHLLIGHLGDFESYNTKVIQHATKKFKGLTEAQIRALKAWQTLHEKKPKNLTQMTEAEKQKLRKLIDKTFPLL